MSQKKTLLLSFALILIFTIILSAHFLFSERISPYKNNPQLEKILKSKLQTAPKETEAFISQSTNRLCAIFDTFLKNPAAYEKRADQECGIFPEGSLYPFTLPALGYTNLAITNPEMKPHACKQVKKLIKLSIPRVVQMVKPPNGDLMALTSYQDHATYLTMLNQILGSYRLIGGQGYDALHDHITELLYQAIKKRDGLPIRSYPAYSWNFDTILGLVSLDLHDRITGNPRSGGLIKRHLEWIDKHATDLKTGLPYSIGWDTSKERTDLPRGCDLSMRICLMTSLAPERMANLYKKYSAAHWIDQGYMAGFAEWPLGTKKTPDVDSGPVIMGIGLTATGVGIGTAKAMSDTPRLKKLCKELAMIQPLIKMAATKTGQRLLGVERWFSDLGISVNSEYLTGFLYGDATLFYALTWTAYPESILSKD